MDGLSVSSNKIYPDENIGTYFSGFVKGVCSSESEMLLIYFIRNVPFN